MYLVSGYMHWYHCVNTGIYNNKYGFYTQYLKGFLPKQQEIYHDHIKLPKRGELLNFPSLTLIVVSSITKHGPK